MHINRHVVYIEMNVQSHQMWLLPLQVNPELKQHFEKKGFHFVGQDVEGERMEVIELDGESAVHTGSHVCFVSLMCKQQNLIRPSISCLTQHFRYTSVSAY